MTLHVHVKQHVTHRVLNRSTHKIREKSGNVRRNQEVCYSTMSSETKKLLHTFFTITLEICFTFQHFPLTFI